MSDGDAEDRDLRAQRRTWVTGGVLLLLSAIFVVAARGPLAGIHMVDEWLFAAACVVFAIGIGHAGSVTRRRIIGTVAIILLVLAPTTQAYWYSFVPEDTGNPHEIEDISTLVAMTYYGVVIVLAIIAVVEIARAKVVPSPWRWAPLWVLIWTPIVFGIGLMLFSSAALGTMPASIGAMLAGYGPTAGVAFLGVLGVVLGVRQRREWES